MNTLAIRLCLCTFTVLSFGSTHAELSTNLAPSADTTLFQHNPDNNLGGHSTMVAGTIGLGDRSRAIFKFDVAPALPANAIVTSATLTLNVPIARGAGQNYNLHTLRKSWSEGIGSGGGGGSGSLGAPANGGETTWNSRFHNATPWNAPGGQAGSDYTPAVSAIAMMGASTMVFTSPGMVGDVQAWLNNPGTNFGWILIAQNEVPAFANASHISTREDSVNAPKLMIGYTVPTSPTPPVLTALPVSNGLFRFSFNVETNLSYTVQFIGDLGETNWSPLTNLGPQSTAQEIVIPDPLTTSNRLYRVQVQ